MSASIDHSSTEVEPSPISRLRRCPLDLQIYHHRRTLIPFAAQICHHPNPIRLLRFHHHLPPIHFLFSSAQPLSSDKFTFCSVHLQILNSFSLIPTCSDLVSASGSDLLHYRPVSVQICPTQLRFPSALSHRSSLVSRSVQLVSVRFQSVRSKSSQPSPHALLCIPPSLYQAQEFLFHSSQVLL